MERTSAERTGLRPESAGYAGLVAGFTAIDAVDGGIDWAYYPAAGVLLPVSFRELFRDR